MLNEYLFDAGQDLIDRRLRSRLGTTPRRFYGLAAGLIWAPALVLAAVGREGAISVYFSTFAWGLALALLGYHLRAGVGCEAITTRHLPLLLIIGLRITALPLLLIPGGWMALGLLPLVLALTSLGGRFSPRPSRRRLMKFSNPILAREFPGTLQMLYHSSMAVLGLGLWAWIWSLDGSYDGCGGSPGTLGFWAGFGVLSLGLFARASIRMLAILLKERRQGTLEPLEHAVACPRTFNLSWLAASFATYALEAITVCTGVLVVAFDGPTAILVQGQVPGFGLALIALAACLLALSLPVLAGWLALTAIRHSQTAPQAWALLVNRSLVCFFLWCLTVPVLAVAPWFPLLPLLAALAFGGYLAQAQPVPVRLCWTFPLLGITSGVILAAGFSQGDLEWKGLSFGILFGLAVAVTVGRFWSRPQPAEASLSALPYYALQGLVVSGLTFLTPAWLASVDFSPLPDLGWVPGYLGQFSPAILSGALVGALVGWLRLLCERPTLVLGGMVGLAAVLWVAAPAAFALW